MDTQDEQEQQKIQVPGELADTWQGDSLLVVQEGIQEHQLVDILGPLPVDIQEPLRVVDTRHPPVEDSQRVEEHIHLEPGDSQEQEPGDSQEQEQADSRERIVLDSWGCKAGRPEQEEAREVDTTSSTNDLGFFFNLCFPYLFLCWKTLVSLSHMDCPQRLTKVSEQIHGRPMASLDY